MRRRVLIVDDHPLLREGLRQLIEREPDLRVCGEAGDVQEALRLIADERPDVVTLDISLPGSSGTTLLRDIRTRHGVPVLVISMHDESLYAERVLREGARGYMNKQEAQRCVVPAIRRVLGGEVWVSERFAARVIGRLASGATQAAPSPVEGLSDRELEVFELVGRGLGPTEIAEKLFLSVKTVQVHKANIRQKLGIRSARELMLRAARWVEGRG